MQDKLCKLCMLVPGWVTVSLYLSNVECVILKEPSWSGQTQQCSKPSLLGLIANAQICFNCVGCIRSIDVLMCLSIFINMCF
jgi:hypothetical protein